MEERNALLADLLPDGAYEGWQQVLVDQFAEEVAARAVDAAAARIAELEQRLADYEADFRAVLAEDCAPDEKHCSCVPHLRQRIAGLRSMIDNGNAVPVLRFNADNDWILTKRAERAEQREQAAWLAAWGAEWRAQEWQKSFMALAGAAATLSRPLEQRLAAQAALLELAEAALEKLAYLTCKARGECWCDLRHQSSQHDEGCQTARATLAALRAHKGEV